MTTHPRGRHSSSFFLGMKRRAKLRRLQRREIKNRSPFSALLRLAAKASLYFIAATLLLIVLFRWVPVPFSSFMLQKVATARLTGEKEFSLRHEWTPIEKISPFMALAVVAAEDQKFPDHHGFDYDAIKNASRENRRRALPRGGSTISQQVAKNLFLWPGRSFIRKGLEACFTLLLEGLWPKRRILEVYLNIAEFGPGIYGAAAASQTFYGKPPASLGQDEAAMLAAVLPNPIRLDAANPSNYVMRRADHIMRQMRLLGGTGYLDGILGPRS